MSDPKPETPSQASATGSSRPADPPPSAAVRHRLPQRPETSQSPRPPILGRRRSSILSFSSLEDVTQSLTDDFISPGINRGRTTTEEDEVTHWHSTPLAFAILPAVGGLLFKNGSAFITDVLLIGLAAIFMNWSIRLPWDWYYSAQTQRRDAEPDYFSPNREMDANETAVESASSAASSPKHTAQRDADADEATSRIDDKREAAAEELRRQELLALLATFVFPMAAAYLLHVIRAQLSQSRTGLVSDYNLSIFLLAAEIRPCRQLIRLVTNRTLHLQRTVTGLDDPFGSAVEEKSMINKLTARVDELETKLSNNTVTPQDMTIAQKADVSDLSAEVKKRYEPRLEGLERAVRRYEKRSATLAALTDQRLGQLETRLQDALSLAAVAAQSSQKRGPTMRLLDTVAAAIQWPVLFAWRLATSPLYVLEEIYARLRDVLLGPSPSRSGKRSSARQGGSSAGGGGGSGGSGRDERPRDRLNMRKIVR